MFNLELLRQTIVFLLKRITNQHSATYKLSHYWYNSGAIKHQGKHELECIWNDLIIVPVIIRIKVIGPGWWKCYWHELEPNLWIQHLYSLNFQTFGNHYLKSSSYITVTLYHWYIEDLLFMAHFHCPVSETHPSALDWNIWMRKLKCSYHPLYIIELT